MILLREHEMSEIIRQVPDGQATQFSFGIGWVKIDPDLSCNLPALRVLAELRGIPTNAECVADDDGMRGKR